MRKKQLLIIVIILAAVIIAGAVYYWQLNKDVEPTEEISYQDLIVFEVKNDDLPQARQEEYFERFLRIRELINQNPDIFDLWLDLGGVHKLIGNYELAEKTWLYACQIRPKNSPAFANLGDLYANFIKDIQRSEQAYLVAIENSEGEFVNTVYSRSLFELYFYYFEDYQRTEEFLFERLEKYPDEAEIYKLLSFFYSRSNQIDKAIEAYEKLIELDPGNIEAKNELAELKAKQRI